MSSASRWRWTGRFSLMWSNGGGWKSCWRTVDHLLCCCCLKANSLSRGKVLGRELVHSNHPTRNRPHWHRRRPIDSAEIIKKWNRSVGDIRLQSKFSRWGLPSEFGHQTTDSVAMETSRAGCNYCARQKTEPLAAAPPSSNDCATAVAEAMSRRYRNCSRRAAGSVSPCTAAGRDSRTSSTKSARWRPIASLFFLN